MSLNFSHQDEICQLFLTEAESLLIQVEERLNHAMPPEEAARTVEHLEQVIVRLKSGGAYLNLPAIEILCHRFEGILQSSLMANAERKPEVLELLRQTLTGLHRLVSTQQRARDDDDAANQIQPIFTQLEEQLTAYSRLEEAATASSTQPLSHFLEDASDWLETIETTLLNLQAGDRSLNNIHRLMRSTHTLKGAASGADLAVIQRMAHTLETLFQALYKPSLSIDSELTGLLFQAYECLRWPISARMTQMPMNEADVLPQFDAIAAQLRVKLGEALVEPAQMPSSQDLGADIVDPIFRTEVAQRLQNLSALVQSEAEDRATRFRAQVEILKDIAGPFNLQGFVDIARMTLLALERRPAQLQSIAQLALRDFQAGLALILEGDRTQGGAVSNELRQLAQPLLPLSHPQFQKNEGRAGRLPLSENAIAGRSEPHTQPLRSQVSLPIKTIRVEISRLEHLNRLTGELLNSQLQQGSTHGQIQDTLQDLGLRFQQHQQSLEQIRTLVERLLPSSESLISSTEGVASVSIPFNRLKIELNNQLTVLLQSALEESIQLADMARQATQLHRQASPTLKRQQQLLREVQNDLIGACTVTLETLFQRLLSVFQQLMVTQNKSARLKVKGAQITVNKAIAEQLYDPLLHLLRNALDHGVETDPVRRQLGKPEIAQIDIHAYKQNDWVVLEIGDDGGGLNYEKIRRQAIESGLLSSELAQYASEQTLAELLFNPGFTTASHVSTLSGRGVGLDIVLSNMQAIGGSVTIRSQPQLGTVVKLVVPRGQNFPSMGSAKPISTSTLSESEIRPDPSEMLQQPISAANLQGNDLFPPDLTDLPSLDDLFSNLNLTESRPIQDRPIQEATLPPLPSPTISQIRETPSIPQGGMTSAQSSISMPSSISPSIDTNPPLRNSTYSEVATARTIDLNLLFAWRFGSVVFTVPFNLIEEHIAPQDRQVIEDLQERFLQWNGKLVSLYSLSDLLKPINILAGLTASAPDGQTPLTLVVRIGQRMVAIESTIHHLMTARELTIQPLNTDSSLPPYIYGSALLSDQFSVLLVDVAALLDQTFGIASITSFSSRQSFSSSPPAPTLPPVIKPLAQTILIIDDSRMVREVLKDTLAIANYQVLEAVDGRNALDIVRRHPEIDLVICDVAMPKMNGFDFLKNFRQQSAFATVPVCMLSTCGSDLHRQLATRLGASAYLTKPYDEQRLLGVIKNLLLQSY